MRIIKSLLAESQQTFWLAVLSGASGGIALTLAVSGINYLLEHERWRQLQEIRMVLLYFVAAAVVGGLAFLSGSQMAYLMQKKVAALRLQLMEKILQARLEKSEAMGKSAIVAMLSDDLLRLANGAYALPLLLVNGAICLASLLYIATMNWRLLLLLLLVQGFCIVLMAGLLRNFNLLLTQAQPLRQRMMDHFHLLGDGLKEFKQDQALQNAFQQGLYAPNIEAVRQSAVRINRGSVGMDAVAKIGFLLSIGLLLFCVAQLPGLADSLELRAVVLAYLFMVTPLSTVLSNVPQLMEAEQALRKIEGFALEAEAPAVTLPVAAQEIGLQQVLFRYGKDDGRNFSVGPVDLGLRRGEIVVLEGGNGSGKTSLAKLLAGLYRPQQGAQRCDGVPTAAEQLASYRSQVAALWSDNTQAYCLLPDAPELQALGRRYWTLLGLEQQQAFASGWVDCRRMSTGQRRRVALVGVLMSPKPFLVFDEWAANQDKEYRALFYSRILPELKAARHGILLIAHDSEAGAIADRRISMRDGRIEEVETQRWAA